MHDRSPHYIYSGSVGELTGSFITDSEMDLGIIKAKSKVAEKRPYRFLCIASSNDIRQDEYLKTITLLGNDVLQIPTMSPSSLAKKRIHISAEFIAFSLYDTLVHYNSAIDRQQVDFAQEGINPNLVLGKKHLLVN